MARWEPSQHERTTALDHSMELQADRTEIAPTGPPEVAEPLCAAHLRCAVRCAPLQEIAETVSRALAYLTDRLIWPYCLPAKAEQCLKLHRRDAPHGQAHPRLAECARHPGAQRRRPCTRARAISRRRRRRRWRRWRRWSRWQAQAPWQGQRQPQSQSDAETSNSPEPNSRASRRARSPRAARGKGRFFPSLASSETQPPGK